MTPAADDRDWLGWPGLTRPRQVMDRWLAWRPRRAPRREYSSLEIDAAQVRQRIAAGVLDEADLLLVLVEDLHRQAERLELLDEHLERFRHAG